MTNPIDTYLVVRNEFVDQKGQLEEARLTQSPAELFRETTLYRRKWVRISRAVLVGSLIADIAFLAAAYKIRHFVVKLMHYQGESIKYVLARALFIPVVLHGLFWPPFISLFCYPMGFRDPANPDLVARLKQVQSAKSPPSLDEIFEKEGIWSRRHSGGEAYDWGWRLFRSNGKDYHWTPQTLHLAGTFKRVLFSEDPAGAPTDSNAHKDPLLRDSLSLLLARLADCVGHTTDSLWIQNEYRLIARMVAGKENSVLAYRYNPLPDDFASRG